MRFLLRSVVLWAVCTSLTAARAAVPTLISFNLHGDFDPGTSGATASNSDTISTLSLRTATVTFSSTDGYAVLLPGNVLSIALGSISTASSGLDALAFDGATLNVTVELLDPPATPSVAVIPLALAGNVGPFGELLTLTASAPLDQAAFLPGDCVPKSISLVVDPVTAAVSGSGPEDIGATLSIGYTASFLPGDIDGDGNVTLIDAVRGLLLVSGMDEAQCDEVERGDLSGSGAIDLVNVVLIARKSYGL